MRYKHTKEDLQRAVNSSLSIAGVCRVLNMKPSGGNYKTLYSKFKRFEIDISHFTGSAWNQGNRYKPFGKKYDLKNVLIENSPYKNTNSLKKRLYIENIKEKKCEHCGITEWNGQPISLELDHINGNNTDNRLVNLRILCPNCHSQTDTFRSKIRSKKLP